MTEPEGTGVRRLTKMLEKLTKNYGFDGPLTDELKHIKLDVKEEEGKGEGEGEDDSLVSNKIFKGIFSGEVKDEDGLLSGCFFGGCEITNLRKKLDENKGNKEEAVLDLLVNSVKKQQPDLAAEQDVQVKNEIKKKLNEYFEKTYDKYNVYKPDFWKAVKIAKVTDGAIIDAVKNTFTVPGQSDEQSEKLKDNLINVLESSGGIGSGINKIIDMVTNGNAPFLPTKSEGTAPSPHTAPDYYGLFASLWKEDGVMHDLKQMTKDGVDNVFPNTGEEEAVSPEQPEQSEQSESEQPQRQPEPSENCYSKLKIAKEEIQRLKSQVTALEKRAEQAEKLSKGNTSLSLFDKGMGAVREMMSSDSSPTAETVREEVGKTGGEPGRDNEDAKKKIFGGLLWTTERQLCITNVSKPGIFNQFNPFYCAQGEKRIILTTADDEDEDELQWSGTCADSTWTEARILGGRNEVKIHLKNKPNKENEGVGTIELDRKGSKPKYGTIFLKQKYAHEMTELSYVVKEGRGFAIGSIWFTMTLKVELPKTSQLAKSLGKLNDGDLKITNFVGTKVVIRPLLKKKILNEDTTTIDNELKSFFEKTKLEYFKQEIQQDNLTMYKWNGALNGKGLVIFSGNREKDMTYIFIESDGIMLSGGTLQQKKKKLFNIKWDKKTRGNQWTEIELEMQPDSAEAGEQEGGKRRRSIAKRNKSKKYTKKRRNVRSGHKRSRGKRSRGHKRSGHKRTKHNRPKHTKRAKHTRRK